MLPKERRDQLPPKPPKGVQSHSATPGAREPSAESQRSGKGGKGWKGKDRTFGEGGRPPFCCHEFALTGKCTYKEKTGKECLYPQSAHVQGDGWVKEYMRVNPEWKP